MPTFSVSQVPISICALTFESLIDLPKYISELHVQRNSDSVWALVTRSRYWDGKALKGDFSRKAAGVELYPHTGDTEEDFDLFENANMAVDPSMAPVLARMHSLVEKQWK